MPNLSPVYTISIRQKTPGDDGNDVNVYLGELHIMKVAGTKTSMDLIRNDINFPMKGYRKASSGKFNKIQQCERVQAPFLSEFEFICYVMEFFVWLLLLLFCHLYSEKFS